jgi:hypothetical protein
MKPLVFYCRWQSATLRLRGRGDGVIWGELVYKDGSTKPFHYNLNDWFLRLGEGENMKELYLDEKGVVV